MLGTVANDRNQLRLRRLRESVLESLQTDDRVSRQDEAQAEDQHPADLVSDWMKMKSLQVSVSRSRLFFSVSLCCNENHLL